ncbi:hypothetical protein CC78DRAFT_543704 [Lojkania enalia]|uniref:Serine/threonine-protein kinase ppk6 n=1 Tax=Lojkania enalia TaxID=147567 RepID=A0A9P4KA89_9PLEO|nr:hypothetical protein CC78DRAFT_543704 [Didymosphaeria enalia]
MSADLFAEFGSTPNKQRQTSTGTGQANLQSTPAFSFFDDLTSTGRAPIAQAQPHPQSVQVGDNEASTTDENDEWGEFEGVPSPQPASAKQDPFPQYQPFQVQQTSWQSAAVVRAKKSSNPNVLFDAEDDPNGDDDDDFGDFEGVRSNSTPADQPGGSTGLEDLLGDMDMSRPKPAIANQPKNSDSIPNRRASSPTKWSPVAGFGSVSREKQPPAAISPSIAKQEEAWDTFDDWEASIPTTAPSKPSNATGSQASIPKPIISSPDFNEPESGELPPTNVPPPAILLSLFPPLFAEAQSKLFRPMAAQTLPMRNKLLAEPATIAYLQGYLMLASTVARIIAGRKLRWKRDMHLSQGMRIGPASSRATSGMKLTGIDKSENMKEERETADVVRAWKDQVGRLRHIVSAANQIKAGTLGTVPDIQETMLVKTLKQSEGGVPAPQPCMLCGLKRDERLGTLDQAVQDSFGEWWVDQVSMHRGCRNFWREHKDKLRQR